MAEFALADAAIVACHGAPAALEAIAVDPEVVAGRVAPDELLLVGPLPARADLLARGAAAVSGAGGMVVDETDAWTAFCLLGDGVEAAFARLSHVALPADRPAFVQGPVAHVPGTIVAGWERLYVLAPAPAAHHVERRLGDACESGPRPEREPMTLADRPVGA